jgi:hypothetical protein
MPLNEIPKHLAPEVRSLIENSSQKALTVLPSTRHVVAMYLYEQARSKVPHRSPCPDVAGAIHVIMHGP